MSIKKPSKAKLKRVGLGINYAKRVTSAEFSEHYSLVGEVRRSVALDKV